MAHNGLYRVSTLTYYVVMEHSTIFTRIGDVDTGSSTGTVETQVSRVYYGTTSKKGLQWLIIIFMIILHTT